MENKELSTPIRNGALYIRVSTHNQEELSPDAQRRLLMEYAAKNNIIISSEYIYEEDGISGRKADKRPAFQNMIAHAKSKEHPFDVILVWKFSRFARNQEESIVYKSMLKKDHVDVISISEPLIDGPFGSLIERIIEWMDEYYSIRLSGEVTRGMTENAMRGNNQASPPLGYTVPYPKATPVIVPEEAEIIHLIFDMYTEYGCNIFDITQKLNELGYQTKFKKPFERRSVTYILNNEMYTGKCVWNKRDSSSYNYKDKSEWIIVDGDHEAIISPEQFEKARARWEAEYHPVNRKPSGICKHWLSGIVKCSSCGRTLSISAAKDKRYGRLYVNFQCYGYLKGKCHVSHQISEKKLSPMVLKSLADTIESGHVDFNIINPSPAADSSILNSLKRKLEDIDKKELRIKRAYMDGIDSIEEYKSNKSILLKERENLSTQLAAISKPAAPASDMSAMIDKIKSVYAALLDDSLTMQNKNEIFKTVVEKIVYDKEKGEIEIHFYSVNPL